MGCPNREVEVATLQFRSRSFRLLAASGYSSLRDSNEGDSLLGVRDVDVLENRSFAYDVVIPAGYRSPRGAILFFHGLNEKFWNKYLPWAREISVRTGRAVVLFPIAFHMNRAPSAWSNPREMARIAAARRREVPSIESVSFANVALSTRLETAPQRFLWSGLQTYYDVLQLLEEIRGGNHPVIGSRAEIGLFGYSIGAFLVEMLMLENPRGVFSASKAFLFCGGSTLGEMAPVSKYIIDSRANEALISFYGDDFDSRVAQDPPLVRLFDRIQTLGETFKSMLFPTRLRETRIAKLASVGKRLAAVLLKRDHVVPQDRAVRTLTEGIRPNDRPSVETFDFSFDYTHEQPFPQARSSSREVERAMRLIMRFAADHLA